MINFRNYMNDLEILYKRFLNRARDIREHLPTLKRLGEEVDHITKFGVRKGASTSAWLMARPKVLRCYDVESNVSFRLEAYKQFAKDNGIDFTFTVANDLEIVIELTELLFIDTSHQYKHTVRELELHGGKVSKYIVFHDTMNRYGRHVVPAIGNFLHETRSWLIKEHYSNNNGLTVLERGNW